MLKLWLQHQQLQLELYKEEHQVLIQQYLHIKYMQHYNLQVHNILIYKVNL